MRNSLPGNAILIVSNSAGTSSDHGGSECKMLHESTGIDVLEHKVKKPGCWRQVLEYLRAKQSLQDVQPNQIAVIGDRLLTDVMMANLAGCWAIWIKDGVVVNNGPVSARTSCKNHHAWLYLTMQFARTEKAVPQVLQRIGIEPRTPSASVPH